MRSPILKLALFATGLSGIVAEYILSTLASYFLGDSIIQWTLTVSVMLFSMGLGSRLSRYIKSNLLQKFIYTEFTLSILVSFAALLTYLASSTLYVGVLIYTLSILIGLLIGLEIPLVIRLNKEFESLRVNISSVMELDYVGSLIGGLFFAFIALPYIGLTYTPFILGSINFLVALILLLSIRKRNPNLISFKLHSMAFVVALIISGGYLAAEPIVTFSEQKKYRDKVVYSSQSKYQKIVITEWKGDYWLYLNGNQQFSTVDERLYHEPLVHPAMQLSKYPKRILVFGGGDGCAMREILKYKSVDEVILIDLDKQVTDLGQHHELLKKINDNSLNHEKVKIINRDGFEWLMNSNEFFDVIISDLPDPRNIELNRLYTKEFFELCHKQLSKNGILITQAGSPYFATQAFKCIDTTMKSAGFITAPLHNHIITLGEWGWVIGRKADETYDLKKDLQSLSFNNVKTKWINNEAMILMTSFGQNIYPGWNKNIHINSIHNPVLYRYYLNGNWDLY